MQHDKGRSQNRTVVRMFNAPFTGTCDHCGMKGHRIRDCRKASEDIKVAWYKQFNERKNAKRKQPDETKPWRGGAVSFLDVVITDVLSKNELPSTSAYTVMPTNVTANMHENMQHNTIDNGTNLMECDKPHRPDSLAFINFEKPYRLELQASIDS